MLVCNFKAQTGFDCPGCGAQRSGIALLEGDFLGSFLLYPALLPLVITISLLFFQLIVKKENGGTWVMYSFIITTVIAVLNSLINNICS